ncbi:5266_t:CDS:2, partial [Scutellospora calospora]
LGSGCGLLGLVMCSLSFETTLTDLASVVDNVLKENLPSDFTSPYDYIVATDYRYSLDLIPHFIKCLQNLSNAKFVIICGMERRDPIVINNFLNQCKKNLWI